MREPRATPTIRPVSDQSLFSESYDDVRGWEETVRATYVEPLGLSAYMALNFVLGQPRATAAELAATLAVAAALVAAALRIGRRRATSNAPRVRAALVASFLLTAVYSMAPETWAGTAFALAVAALATVLLAQRQWTLEHVAAIATGALLARGALAFTYYPVVGETAAAQKDAHNVVMLALVVAAGVYSCTAARRRPLPA